jgi:hypothetical protein
MSNGVPELPAPMELLDLEHANSITLGIDRYEQGLTTIHPKTITPRDVRIFMQQQGLTEPPAAGVPIFKQIPVLRVYGSRVDKPSPSTYWDISSLTLQASLLPILTANAGRRVVVTLTAQGVKPTKRYSVELVG